MFFGQTQKKTAEQLIGMALDEDLGLRGDVTTSALISEDETGSVQIVARSAGVLAGLPVAQMVFDEVDRDILFAPLGSDGESLTAGQVVGEVSGSVRSLLVGERTCLNFLSHLSGIATLTHRYVEAVAGTRARIYDTRKTLPGWRALQKYAVLAGGGCNHRLGLDDMVLIKDNHLAEWRANATDSSLAAAVGAARRWIDSRREGSLKIEVEVDTLDQFTDALAGGPDIILLDNMTLDEMRQAADLRNARAPHIELEASGGVSLSTVAAIARTGVERISVGGLTHSAPALDLAFDWK